MSKETEDINPNQEGQPTDAEPTTEAPHDEVTENGTKDPSPAEAASDEEVCPDPEEDTPVTLERSAWKDLVEKAEKGTEYWDRFVRLNAEFDNFKKRSARERSEAVKYANEALLERLIPTLDHFEMAMLAVQHAKENSLDSIKMGIEMVHGQLKSTLKDAGLEEIDAAGKVFDPAWHEAVSQKETNEVPEGQVVEQARKGYKLNERLLRPANVVVAKAPGADPEEAAS